jgi:hypothetical protein
MAMFQVNNMTNNAPVIDMTPDGRFVDRAGPKLGTIALRLLMFGIGLCVIAAVASTMLMLLPVILLLAVISYLVARLRF